ncbi:MAG: L,D-transpeptidase, partial [Clostridia bacterium]|nr:L,D-transpeptidase [Clostridia bacterium]
KNHAKIGTVSGTSQGVNVLVTRNDGWSLVEAYRNEDGAFVRGYIKTAKLKLSDVNTLYGFVIDKRTQTLTVYMNGQRIGSCLVCTGLPTVENLNRETPAGEFRIAMRRGVTEYVGKQKGYSRYTIRINNNVYLQEIPTTKRNGSDYSMLETYLGSKQTRGTICVQARASQDGGMNAEALWNITDTNKKVKVLIIDDKTRDMIPVGIK